MTDPLVRAANERLQALILRAAQMGIRFVDVRPGTVQATVPLEGNSNHFGVMYAGVTFTVAEVLGGALHAATWDVTTHFPLVKSMSIDFTAPGTTPLTARVSLSPAEIERVRAEATPDGKASFVLEAEVTGEDGTVVARTRGDYQIRPWPR
jgi:acyl-coenzyme A thioesterase PaaI-like protein